MSQSDQNPAPDSIPAGDSPAEGVFHNFPKIPTFSENRDDLSDEYDVGLSCNQLAAMDLIVSGASDVAVAESLNISRRTVYNWKVHDSAFRRELDRRRRAILHGHADRMRRMLETAITALEKQVGDNYAPAAHRAAKTILSVSRIGRYVDMSIDDGKRKSDL